MAVLKCGVFCCSNGADADMLLSYSDFVLAMCNVCDVLQCDVY